MKRFILTAVVMLTIAAAAQAEMATYAEITYPTTTTWKLWLTLCDWQGTTEGLTPSGYGIPSFNVQVSNVVTASKMMPPDVTLRNNDGPPTDIGTVGFPNGPASAAVTGGAAQLFAGQDTTIPDVLIRGFGVTAGAYTPPAGWSTSASYSWDAPGAPGSANPGVLVFGGTRIADQAVSIDWEHSNGKTFLDATGVSVMALPLVPEPAMLSLLALAGTALAVRRRR